MGGIARESVVVVDDEPQIRVALQDLLSARFSVTAFPTAEAALVELERRPEVAVLVTDERMPHMQGHELLERLGPQSATERILLTGFTDLDVVTRAVNDGQIFAYVTKPWDPSDLISKVTAAATQFRLSRELARERALFSELMDNVPDGVYFTDDRLRFRRVNRGYAAMFGWKDPAELLGKSLAEGKPAGSESLDVDRQVLRGERVVVDHIWKHGARWYSETKGRVIVDGRPGVVGIVRDVTDRMAAAEQLETSEARYREQSKLLQSILRTLEEGVLVADEHMGIVMANPPAQRLLGLSQEEASARDWAAVAGLSLLEDGSPLDAPHDPLLRAIAGQYTPTMEVSRPKGSAEKARLALTGLPLEDDGRREGGIVVIRDVTEQRTLEQQLLQAQKMEVLGQLSGGVAHDFNNLLAIIIGYGQMLRGAFEADDPRRADADELLQAAERATTLTRQLLGFSRIKQAEPRPLSLNDIVRSFERMMSRLLPPNIELCLRLPGEVGGVRADAGQLEQVLLNLIVNARDAMPHGGKITVMTHPSESPVGAAPAFVALEVRDQGKGVPKEMRSRIFEPFFTTKPVGVGTGLGLSTVLAIVQQAGGSVDIEDAPEGGACFRVLLPACELADASAPVRSGEEPIRGGSGAVLVVDDEPGLCRVIARILGAEGFTVFTADGAEKARALCQNRRFDVIVSDVNLPDTTGPELVRQLLSTQDSAAVVFMSGRALEPSADRLPIPTRYLQKPFQAAELLRTVHQAASKLSN